LWEEDLTGTALIGAIDRGALELFGDYTHCLTYGGIPGYLNAGVLLMNLKLIRELNLDREAFRLLNSHHYRFADQDVLNIVCKGRTRAVDIKWNSGGSCGVSTNPVIEHFVSCSDFFRNPECKTWQNVKQEYARFLEQEWSTPKAPFML
jgi:lipopolysaccharide biosynthesis glycosyltransferase